VLSPGLPHSPHHAPSISTTSVVMNTSRFSWFFGAPTLPSVNVRRTWITLVREIVSVGLGLPAHVVLLSRAEAAEPGMIQGFAPESVFDSAP
jgi:hypothetical protein